MDDTTDLAPTRPADGATKVEGKKRFGWDSQDSCWRILPMYLDKSQINPFDPEWRAARPLKTIDKLTRYGKKPTRILVDQNEVRVHEDGTVKKNAYPGALERLGHFLPGMSRGSIKRNQLRKIENFLLEIAKNESSLSKYIEGNRIKPEAMAGFYTALMRLILTAPQVGAAFLKQFAERAATDPIKALEKYKELTGLPIQLVMNNAPASYVSLNVFNAEPDEKTIEGELSDEGDGE